MCVIYKLVSIHVLGVHPYNFLQIGVYNEKGLETTELDYVKGAPSTKRICNTQHVLVLIL